MNLLKYFQYFILYNRKHVGSTNQGCSYCNFFRVAWKLMERPCFLQTIPSHFCRASEASKIDCFKNYKKCGPILMTLSTTSKLHDPKKFQFPFFYTKITLILMIEKMPLTFSVVKNKVIMAYFMFVLMRPCRNEREWSWRKQGRSVNFHAILKKLQYEQAWSVDPTDVYYICTTF